MDEVCSEIHKDETSKVELKKENISNEDQPQCQQTLGEMTVEFLVKARS